jgi:hypothetical protein
MLFPSLWLWKQVKGPLKSILNEKFSLLSGQFKSLLSSTIDDLIAALQEVYFSTDAWRHLADAKVEEVKGKKREVQYKVFPIAALEDSSKIKAALVARLLKNVPLDAARNKAGVGNEEWKRTLEAYSGTTLRFGLALAIRKMIRNELAIFSNEYVIDLAEAEPIKIKEIREGKTEFVAGYHELIVTFSKHSSKGFPTLGDATKFWKNRTDSSYTYKRGDYDGFKAT